MKLESFEIIPKREKIHFYDSEIKISSFFNKVFFSSKDNQFVVNLPVNFMEKVFGLFRITRRLLRLDMCNVFISNGDLIIIRNGIVYHYNVEKEKLTKTIKLKQCRNILHQSYPCFVMH